jgi:hypothetical protein
MRDYTSVAALALTGIAYFAERIDRLLAARDNLGDLDAVVT